METPTPVRSALPLEPIHRASLPGRGRLAATVPQDYVPLQSGWMLLGLHSERRDTNYMCHYLMASDDDGQALDNGVVRPL
jgi:hypothetical protein